MNMKKMKALLSLMLVMCLMLALFAACSKQEATPAQPTEDQTETAQPAPEKEEQTPEKTEEPEPEQTATPEEPDEIVDLDFYYYCTTTFTDEGVENVQRAMNEILNDKIGVNVKLHPFKLAEYRTQVPMDIAANEKVDVCFLYGAGTSFSTMMATHQLQDLSGYLDTYAPETVELLGDKISAFSIGDATYAIPGCFRNFSTNLWVMANKGTLEELNLLDQFYAMESWTDYEAIMQAVKDNTTMYPIGGQKYIMWNKAQPLTWSSDSFEFEVYDTLGDSLNMIHASVDKPEVTSIFDVEGTAWMMKKAKEWMDRGFAYPDSYLTQETCYDLVGSGTIFSFIIHCDFTAGTGASVRAGIPVAASKISDGTKLVSTASYEQTSCVIPITCEEPEAATRFINELYTNADIVNLFYWGVEGDDYVINEIGEACYPNGDSNVGYHSADWVGGNYFLALPWDGNGADFRERAYAAAQTATISPYMGFIPETTDLDLINAALSGVYDQYAPYLGCGFYSDEGYQEMMAQFESVGLREYVDAFQTQLDAWLASR